MRITQYMTDKVHTADPKDGLRKTFFRMREAHIRHMPVVDEDRRVVGFISDRDLRRPDWVDEAPDVAHVYRLDDDLVVGDVMTRNVVAVHTYDSIGKAAAIIRERRFGALPVLNKDDELVGVLSAIDLVRALEDVLATQKPGK
jgi:acetoin utilization protein AcuB